MHADSPEAILEKAKAFLHEQVKDASPKGRKSRPQEALAKVIRPLYHPGHPMLLFNAPNTLHTTLQTICITSKVLMYYIVRPTHQTVNCAAECFLNVHCSFRGYHCQYVYVALTQTT